ncbi:MAG: NUDIX hydrolase [Candidatus Thorarchaeota archaeon]|jgi:ADP-ribose pyrophosphatase YjhB (NUDIX family)
MNERSYPRYPIPGVGVIVVGSKGVLLVRRDKDPGKGLWSIPGGGVELGETQEESVIREVSEETGVQCEVIDFVSTYDLISPDESGRIESHFLLNHYLARALTETITPEIPEAEVGWFHLDDLPEDMASPRITELILSMRNRIIDVKDEFFDS